MSSIINKNNKSDKMVLYVKDINFGNNLIYLPSEGRVGIYFEKGNPIVENIYMKYLFQEFGKAEISYINSRTNLSEWNGATFLARYMKPDVVLFANRIGVEIADLYFVLNNKYTFQQIVTDTLGKSYTTKPFKLDEGSSIYELQKAFSYCMKAFGENLIVRVADIRYANGGGKGVKAIQQFSELRMFLEGLGVLENNVLKCSILIEKYIIHTVSPSCTFYLGAEGGSAYGGVTFLSVNHQLLEGSKFIAATNILPEVTNKHIHKIKDIGVALARKVYDMGARGFLGFDMILDDEGKIHVVECNYRVTAATIPEYLCNKAKNFVSDTGWAYWIHIPALIYNESCKSIEDVFNTLEKEGYLFHKENYQRNILNLQLYVIPIWRPKDTFGLVIFMEKSEQHNEYFLRGIERIFELLHQKMNMDFGSIGKI